MITLVCNLLAYILLGISAYRTHKGLNTSVELFFVVFILLGISLGSWLERYIF